MPQYGTELPATLDDIIQSARVEKKLRGAGEVLRYLRSRGDDGRAVVIRELDDRLPRWRSMTDAQDKDAYILKNKLPYRVNRSFHAR